MTSPETASPTPLSAADDHPPPPLSLHHQPQSPINPTDPKPQSPMNSPSATVSPPVTTVSSPSDTVSVPMCEVEVICAALSEFETAFDGLKGQLDRLKFVVENLVAKNQSESSKIGTLSLLKETHVSKIETLPCLEELKSNSGEELKTGFDGPSDGKLMDGLDVDRELKIHCETMNARGLKRYLVLNLKDIGRLRGEVAKALKYAPNAAKLVLECAGRFFMQGSKAYVKGSPMVTGREASVLILECFLLMEGGEDGCAIDEEVKEEADSAAMLWKKRIIGEGGILKADEIDARGLLLLLGGYGVPQTFKEDDLRDLFRVSNVREMAGTLGRSNILMAKVPEIIDQMIKNKLEVYAIDVAYTFGFEERFNVQTIVTSLFQKYKEPLKKGKRFSQTSPSTVNEANRKQLGELKSLVKVLEGHKIDFSKIIPGFQVREKIISLKKDINEYDKKMGAEKTQKRKAEEAEAGRKSKFQEGKRSRYTGHNTQRNLLDAGMAGHLNGYSASQSMLHAQVAGTGYAAAGAYGGMVVDQSGHLINHGVQPYGWHADPALTERVVTHSYAAQPSSTTMSSLYRPSSSSLEGYAMLPSGSSISAPNRGAPTDLYQFADTVIDNEYHPPVVPSNHTSYLY